MGFSQNVFKFASLEALTLHTQDTGTKILILQPSLHMAARDEGERRRREIRGGGAAHPPAGDRPQGLAGRGGAAQQAHLPRLPQEACPQRQMPREEHDFKIS